VSTRSDIGAFFDLDGTLIPWPSLEWRFAAYLFARGELAAGSILRWFGHSAREFLRYRRTGIDNNNNKFYLAGLPESLVSEWAGSSDGQSVQFLQDGLHQIAWHIAEGHRIVFVSGTLAPLARAVARQLPGEIDVIATGIESTDGRWTGRIAGDHVRGREKACAIFEFADGNGLRLDQSYAYGDQISDLPMLESVGHPVAANPGFRLERAARLRGWPICDWRALCRLPVRADARCLSAKGVA